MPPREVFGPAGGAANNSSFGKTPARSAPVDSIRNARLIAPKSARPRFGQRPGLTLTFDQRLADGPIQGLAVVRRASGTSGYETGTVTPVTAIKTRESEALHGQAWVLNRTHGMLVNFQVSGAGSAYLVGAHPTLRRFAFATFTGGATVTTTVRMADCDPTSATFGTILWATTLDGKDWDASGTAVNIFSNHVLVTETFTYVCGFKYLFVLRTSDGAYLKRYDLSGWSGEVMKAIVRPDGYLAVAYAGADAAAGPVTLSLHYESSGGEGRHFRGGVALFSIDTTKTTAGDSMLTATQFGAKMASSDPMYEDHVHFRLSDRGVNAPRGYVPTSIAAAPDNSIYVARYSKGWGPTTASAAHQPTDLIAPYNLCKISSGTSSALMSWEADTGSRLDAYTAKNLAAAVIGTWHSDIPSTDVRGVTNTPGSPHPSADAIVTDPEGNFYVGGSRLDDPTGDTVCKVSSDGVVLWRQNTGEWVSQHAIAYSPVSGLLYVGGRRNDYWDGSGGADASLWALDPTTGEIVETFDFGVNGPYGFFETYGVDVTADGDIVFGTEELL